MSKNNSKMGNQFGHFYLIVPPPSPNISIDIFQAPCCLQFVFLDLGICIGIYILL